MLKIPAKHVDKANIALLILSCGLAHLFPYHLLLFSYAVLGPAHYLTEISWLHDRRYFAASKWLAPLLVALSVALTGLSFYNGVYQFAGVSVIFGVALWLAAFFILTPAQKAERMLILVGGMFSLLLITASFPVAVFVTTLVPTFLHIFVFTAAFMWLGARKSGRVSAYLAVLVLILGAASFAIPQMAPAPNLQGLWFFRPLVAYMQGWFGLSSTSEAQFFGFLSFAYTYHYLNWFSKAEIIHWDKIPPRRLQIMAVVYVITLAVYAYDFEAGYKLILLLSLTHILLEFPLNIRSFAAIARGKAA